MKPSGPGLLCVGSFLITISISSGVTGLFRLSASLHWVLESYIFLESCPFYLGFQISWHTVLCSNLTILCYFSGICCSLSSFISNCVYVDPLSFFLMSLLKVLSILIIFSKNQLLDSLILTIVLLVSVSFNSALILVISFLLLLQVVFVVVPRVLVGVWLGCLFELFLFFLR